jgi:hypothetical protein
MPSPTIAVPRRSDRVFLAQLSGLTRERRLADYRAGLYTRHQLSLWATNFPEEVPLVNGELPWIALGLANIDGAVP